MWLKIATVELDATRNNEISATSWLLIDSKDIVAVEDDAQRNVTVLTSRFGTQVLASASVHDFADALSARELT
jgi:hypothetical protein